MLVRKLGSLAAKIVSVSLAAVLFIGGFAIYKVKAATKSDTQQSATGDLTLEENGSLGFTSADFGDVVLGRACEVSSLSVFKRSVSQKETVTETSVLNVKYLTKKQSIKFVGDAVWSVNLSKLSKGDVAVDNDNKTVTLSVPAPGFTITLDPSKTKNGKVEKGSIIAFGDIRITPKQYKELQNRALKDMYKTVEASDDLTGAKKEAASAIAELFNPVIKSVARGYEVKVVFK